MNYEVFDSSGNSIFPTNGYGGLQSFNGTVNRGDTVLLNLYFSNTYGVVMFAKDYNTGAMAAETYSAEGASQFEGNPSNTANSNGFFTGLMTEWYHSAPFYSNVSPVTYSNPDFALSSAWMWMDEFSCSDVSCSNPSVLFSDATDGPVSYSNPNQLQVFSSHGATEYSDAHRLITGPAYWALTVSYTVNGGGAGYAQPSFIYTYNGVTQSAVLTQFPSTYEVDVDSGWSVSGTLGGSSQTERWTLTSPQANGTATSSQTLYFVYQHQYRLIVTGGSGGSNGDGWYDAGSTALASSTGVFGRSDGSGERVTSYSIDGTTTQVVPTTGLISVNVLMTSPHQVVFTSVQQFQVSLDGGAISALNSITPPTVSGDSYWYDNGSQVNLVLNGVWGRTSGTGFRLLSYSVNGATAQVETTGSVPVLSIGSISAPESVTTVTTVQYELMTPTGSVASVTSPPIFGDTGWYDSGAPVTVTYDRTWDVVPLQSRVIATSYNVNGGSPSPLPQSGNGTFAVELIMNSPQTVNVESATQFYTSFKYTDASGSKAIAPTSLQISVDGQTLEVNGSSVWLINGSTFTVSRLIYEGVDVKPTPQTEFSVSQPSVVTLRALVYDVSLKVTDFLGLPVPGAQVSMTLANGTTITGTTNGDGVFSASSIPLGNFTARVFSIVSATQLSGDASKQQVTLVSVPFSDSSLALVVASVVVAAAASVFLLRRRSKDRSRISSVTPQPTG